MNNIYKNISDTTTTLIDCRDNIQIERLSICSRSGVDASIEVRLESLFRNENETLGDAHEPDHLPQQVLYILNQTILPAGVTLVLEERDLMYDSTVFHLVFKTDIDVDIIMTKK
jgi:hypothetical protein